MSFVCDAVAAASKSSFSSLAAASENASTAKMATGILLDVMFWSISGAFLLLTIRFLWVLLTTWLPFRSTRPRPKNSPVRTLVVLGSGGHTAEMLRLLRTLNPQLYSPRLYLLAETDSSSVSHVEHLESHWVSSHGKGSSFAMKKIPRSRHVGQSWFSSLRTTLQALRFCWPLLRQFDPQLILANGPGTCVPVCLLAFVARVLFLGSAKVVFVESICRVRSLSLSAWILLPFVNHLLIQWPFLRRWPRLTYLGRFA